MAKFMKLSTVNVEDEWAVFEEIEAENIDEAIAMIQENGDFTSDDGEVKVIEIVGDWHDVTEPTREQKEYREYLRLKAIYGNLP